MKRRNFIKSTAALATIAAPAIVRGQNLNSKVQMAGIGADGKGWSDIEQMALHDGVQMIAFTDIDLSRTAKVKRLSPDAPLFQDFRQMLADLGDKIDACTVSTPDHMHAYIAINAMLAGKHVYVQKPLSHNVWEARQMQLLAQRKGLITRMGNQIHSHKFYRTGTRLIKDGAIGKVKEVHSWVGTPGHGRSGFIERPTEVQPVPDTIDWDLWVGVAPMRPYHNAYAPFSWRDWQDFGSGAIGDFGCHIFDPVFTALNLTGAPLTIHNEHTGMNGEVWPAQETIKYVFPGTEHTAKDTINITWYDGGRRPAINHEKMTSGKPLPSSGSIFIGEKGNLVQPHVGAPQLHPEATYADYKYEMADDQNHYHGWVDGILSGEQPSDGFDYGCPMTEVVQLGNVATRFRNQSLEWDAAAMKFTNMPEADKFLTREYRKGWEIEPVA